MRLKRQIASAVLILLALGAVWYYYHPSSMTTFPDHSVRTITVGSATVQAEVVSSDASRQEGLSGRASLPDGQGMLFVFAQDGTWGFWMKDMNFAIDIVWADANGSIITIAPDVSPDTYPQILYPSAPARYVIELPAGWTQAHGLAVGQKIVL